MAGGGEPVRAIVVRTGTSRRKRLLTTRGRFRYVDQSSAPMKSVLLSSMPLCLRIAYAVVVWK